MCINIILDLSAFLGAVWFLISKTVILFMQFYGKQDLVEIESKISQIGYKKNENTKIDD